MENPDPKDDNTGGKDKTDDQGKLIPNQPASPLNEVNKAVSEDQPSNQETTFGDYKVLYQYSLNRIPRRYDRVGVIIQAALAILTLITLILFYFSFKQQKWATDEALKRTDSANKLTRQALYITKLAYAKSVASASMDSIMTIKDTLARDRNTKRELRAYLSIKSYGCKLLDRNRTIWWFEIMNTGKTPARSIAPFGGCDTCLFMMDAIGNNLFDWSKSPWIGSFSQGNQIGDSLLFISKISESVTDKTFANIYIGRDTLYQFVYISYYDIFGDLHRTVGCFYITGTGGGRYITSRYPKYNDGD